MLATDKQALKDEIALAKQRRANEQAKIDAERALRPDHEYRYTDVTENFDQDLYNAIRQSEIDAVDAPQVARYEAQIEKDNADRAKTETKQLSDYDKSNDKRNTKKESAKEMLATDKQALKDEIALAKQRRANEQAKIDAERALRPDHEYRYTDVTENFDQDLYNAIRQSEIDAVDAPQVARYEAQIEKDNARQTKQENKLSANYTANLDKRKDVKDRIEDMLAADKQYAQDEKRVKDKARAEEKAQRDAEKALRPDFEYRYQDVTENYNEAEYNEIRQGEIDKKDAKDVSLYEADVQKDITNRTITDHKLLVKYDKVIGESKHNDLLVKEGEIAERDDAYNAVVKELEQDLETKEMLYFKEDYDLRLKRNKRRLKKAKKYGKFMLEYGSTYDPEWDGEFNNYGLPEIHPFTEGVKLSESKRRTPKRERLSHFDKKKLSLIARDQSTLDTKMVEARVKAEYTALTLEVAKAEQVFGVEYRTREEKQWLRDSKEKLKDLKVQLHTAVKYEKLDNERYYSVVATDFDTVELPNKADREELVAMREELLRLLDIRDDINSQLYELYTGTENGMSGSIEGRANVTLKARKKAHYKMSRYFKVLSKHRVTRNEKMRIFDKMDEFVELRGELAKIKYILNSERPAGKVRRDYIKDLKNAKHDSRVLQKIIERATIRALKKARKREMQERAIIMSYTVLIALLLIGLAMFAMGPQILEALKMFLPESIHGYLDTIINLWPF